MMRCLFVSLFVVSLFLSFASSRSLTVERERKIEDIVGVNGEYEGSGVSLRNTPNQFIVVVDNRDDLLLVDRDLEDGEFVGSTSAEGYEGVAYDFQGNDDGRDETFSVVESVENDDGDYVAVLYTFDNDFDLEDSQELQGVTFESDNKGFEGLSVVRYEDGDRSSTGRYLLALCEGNSCRSGDEGREGGNGRIQVFAEDGSDWTLVDTIDLPSTLDFQDYSGMDIDGTVIAVVSQEESQLWIGELAVRGEDDFYINGRGKTYDFPRNSDDDIIYCNIEGVTFLQSHSQFPVDPENCLQIVAVSDRKKSDQPDRCGSKDQSVHIFNIPEDDDDDDGGDDDDSDSGALAVSPSVVFALVIVVVQMVLVLV